MVAAVSLASLCGCSKDEPAKTMTTDNAPPPAAEPKRASAGPSENIPPPTVEQYAAIINIAGRERMLTQKMAKEALLATAGIDADANRKNVGETVELYKKSLRGLKDGDESLKLPRCHIPLLTQKLEDLANQFSAIEPVFKSTISGGSIARDQLPKFAKDVDSLVENMEIIVAAFSGNAAVAMGKVGKDSLNIILDVSGRQRMFTQKMSKDALLVYLGADPDMRRLELKKTASLYDKVLGALDNGDKDIGIPGATNPGIRAQLEVVRSQWRPFYEIMKKHAESKEEMSKAEIELIAKVNLPLLQESNKVVELYQDTGATAAPEAAKDSEKGADKKEAVASKR